MIQKDSYQTQSSSISLHTIPADEINKIAKKLKDSSVGFCRKLIMTPSISGNEKTVADLYLKEMEKLGYDSYFRDEGGNVIGIIRGIEDGPTIMYNSHLDHVDPGDLSE